MEHAIRVMEDVFREVSAGDARMPQRMHVGIPEYDGDALFMPSYSPALRRMGMKVITLHAGNRERGLPYIQALVMLLDAETGTPLAIMNGPALTAIRTGAATGLATELLARSDASCVAVFGAGVQARSQLEAVCAVRPVRHVRVFDPDTERAADCAAQMSELLDVKIVPASSPSSALANADIVCTATTSSIPVFEDSEIGPGVHLNAIGSYKKYVREIPAETVVRARVVVDQTDAAWEEAGDLIMARDEGMITHEHVHAELGQIIAGELPGRESDDQVTLFKSVGLASQDLAAADAVFDQGTALGLGTGVGL